MEPATLAIIGISTLALGSDGKRPGGTPPPGPHGNSWISPLPIWKSRAPVVSDYFQLEKTEKHRQHLGVDIMYRRSKSGRVSGDEEPIDDINGSSGFFMPKGMVAVACHDGEIWSTGESDLGFNVVIDCGKPYAIFYQHLSTLLIPTGIQRGKAGDRTWPIRAGEPLGVVGGARTGYGLRHLHLEVWYKGARESAIDPRSATAPVGGLDKWKPWEVK